MAENQEQEIKALEEFLGSPAAKELPGPEQDALHNRLQNLYPKLNSQLAQYPRAKKLLVYAIQVECPECYGICKTLGRSIEPAVNNLLAIDPTLIPREFEMDLVKCNNCGKTFSLPEDAFC